MAAYWPRLIDGQRLWGRGIRGHGAGRLSREPDTTVAPETMRVVTAPKLEVMRHGNLHGRRMTLPKCENGLAKQGRTVRTLELVWPRKG